MQDVKNKVRCHCWISTEAISSLILNTSMHHFIASVGLSAVKSFINQLCSSLWRIEWSCWCSCGWGHRLWRIHSYAKDEASDFTNHRMAWSFSGHQKTKQCVTFLLFFSPSIAPRRLTNISANTCCPRRSLIIAGSSAASWRPPKEDKQHFNQKVLLSCFD